MKRLLAVLALIVAFAVGVGLGQALHDQPGLGGTQTLIRTLTPALATPAPVQTVTVTVTTSVP